MELDDDTFGLFKIKPEDYGPNYRDVLFEQYKLYIEMADKVSDRRLIANNFFLTANMLLVSIYGVIVGKVGLLSDSTDIWSPIFSISGLAFNITWFYTVKSYRQLNSGKFKVIHEIEKHLPLALFGGEWIALGKGHDTNRYRPLTNVEKYAPFTFGLVYIMILLLSIRSSSN